MSNSGGYALPLTRTHGPDRFYNPPAARLLQQQQQQQQQLHTPLFNSDTRPDLETQTDSDDSTLSTQDPGSSSSRRGTANLTNLDRVMESVTPSVRAQFSSERMRGWKKTPEFDGNPYFCLGDLWESFREWSAYGVEVPLVLNGSESVKQYYVPYLSGIQLYVQPHRLRRRSEDSDAESSRETSSAGSSDCEAEKQVRGGGGVDGAWLQRNLMNINSQRLSRLTLRDRPPLSSSSDETEACRSPGLLIFEYLEQDQPHFRLPFYDKVVSLASKFPDINKYRSYDLLPSSWFSVAWYPIYRIPVGSTLRSLDASFLTFHSLSTHYKNICKSQPQLHASSSRKAHGVDVSLKISLPIFALAFYKLRGSMLTPGGSSEWQQADSLLQAADNWLRHLRVNLPDYQFFISYNSQRR